MVSLRGICKRFSGKLALKPLSLEVAKGEIFGLLGHNGAGKSTALGIMLGHVRPDGGDVLIGRHSVRRHRAEALKQVGAIFETPCFYEYLSGWDNLMFFVSLSGRAEPRRVRDVLKLVRLDKRIHDRVSTYSHGMRQRLALAQALLPKPTFILLDEPNEGLDPEGIQEMRRLILKLREEEGMTIMFSSHILAEVEQLCDRIAILNQGKMIFCGGWRETIGTDRVFEVEVDDWETAFPAITSAGAAVIQPGTVIMPIEADPAELAAAVVGAGLRLRRLNERKKSLEDFYMEQVAS